jgi:hypothetical protein
MANQGLLWKAVEHSGTKAKGKHVILVAYRPELAVTRRNKVIAFAPMYDLRDADMNGSTSWGEKLAPWIFTPFGLGGMLAVLDNWSCVNDVASQFRDDKLRQAAQAGALRGLFEVCAVAQTTMLVDRLFMPGVQLTLAKSGLAEMTRLGGMVPFVVEKASRTAVIQAVTLSRH